MTRRIPDLGTGRAAKPAAFAGGLLALALAAGCGSSGSGTVQGPAPTAAASSASPTEFPGPSSSLSDSPTPTTTPSDSLRDFNDSTSGISLTVPVGYVIATTPAEAASRFPRVLGSGSDVPGKISDAQSRLRKNTIMIAFHAPIRGLSDNVGLLKIAGSAPSDPAEIQSLSFQSQARTSLTGVGAKNIQFSDTKLGGVPAEQVEYSIASTGGSTVYGEQFYVSGDSDVFILTVTAGTADRAQSAADDIAGSWTFS